MAKQNNFAAFVQKTARKVQLKIEKDKKIEGNKEEKKQDQELIKSLS